MIVREFLPSLIGAQLTTDLLEGGPRLYRIDRDPYIPFEFADAAYRYGHSQIRARYQVNARLMARYGIGGAVDLDWWQAVPIGELIVTCVPARHFSARGLSDRNRNLWSGFVVSAPSGHVYFAGDTGWGAHFESIGARFDPIRLALLPIGSYRPRWFMQPAHIDPAQAVDAHFALGARTSIAVHFGTFALGDDGEYDPLHDLNLALAGKALAENGNPPFLVLDQGEGRDLP